MMTGGLRSLPAQPLYLHKGGLFGANGSTALLSVDGWLSAKVVALIPDGVITDMHVTSNDTLIVAASGNVTQEQYYSNIYRIPKGGSPTKVLGPLQGTVWNWGITSKGSVVFIAEYPNQGVGGKIYRSINDGSSFASAYEVPTDEKANAHLHAIYLDPFTDILWCGRGDDAGKAQIFTLSSPSYDARTIISTENQPTAIVATENYILFGQDQYGGNGILRYDKTTETLSKVLDLSGTNYNLPNLASLYYDSKTGYAYAMTTILLYDENLKSGCWKASDPFTEWELIHEINPATENGVNGSGKLLGVCNNQLFAMCGFVHSSGINNRRCYVINVGNRARRKQQLL